jgi:hypothetical protein
MCYDSWAARWAAMQAAREEKERGWLGNLVRKKEVIFFFKSFYKFQANLKFKSNLNFNDFYSHNKV